MNLRTIARLKDWLINESPEGVIDIAPFRAGQRHYSLTDALEGREYKVFIYEKGQKLFEEVIEIKENSEKVYGYSVLYEVAEAAVSLMIEEIKLKLDQENERGNLSLLIGISKFKIQLKDNEIFIDKDIWRIAKP